MNTVVPLLNSLSTFILVLRDRFEDIDAEASCYMCNEYSCRAHRRKSNFDCSCWWEWIQLARKISQHCFVAVLFVVSSLHPPPSGGVSRFQSAQTIAILLSVWSASKGSRRGGGCHEAIDHSCGNGCAMSGRFYSCTEQGFGSYRCAFVPE